MSSIARQVALPDDVRAAHDNLVRSLPRPFLATIEELTYDNLSAWPLLAEEAHAFFRAYGWVLHELATCPCVRRLTGVKVLGVRKSPAALQQAHGVIATTHFAHDRWTHSKHVASYAIALGIKLKIPHADILVSALAACLHDVGHAAFSHDGDYMLTPNGFPSHEERGMRIIRTDFSIRRVLRAAGVDPEHVISVVAEEGRAGRIQSLMDTAAYVQLDSQMVGLPVPSTYATDIIDSIDGITAHSYLVNRVTPLSWVMTRRGELGRKVYFAPENKLYAAALACVLQTLYRRKELTLDDVADSDDDGIAQVIAEVMHRPRVPPWLRSASALTLDTLSELSAWSCRRFATTLALAAYRERLTDDARDSCIVLVPRDFTSTKSLSVVSGGLTVTLAAPKTLLRDSDCFFYAFVYQP